MVAFIAGSAALWIGLGSGLAAHEDRVFAVHATQHLLVAMIAPILLAASGAVTLALQTLSSGWRAGLRHLVHGPAARRVTHPYVGLALVVSGLAVAVLPATATLAAENIWAHVLLHWHLLVGGLVFWWPLVGVDRALRSAPGTSILAVGVLVPVHAFIAVSLLSAAEPVSGDAFVTLARAWAFDPMADQRTGAAILWIGGEVTTILAAVLVGRRWLGHQRRIAIRIDRELSGAEA